MRALSLFSGIGGIDLACEWAGIKTVAFCEWAEFPRKVLRKHWPGVPIYEDVRTLSKERLDTDGIGSIELIHGGYPCQPFSHAGQRKGTEDDRHLWPEYFRLVKELRPRWVVGENVAGHVTLGLDIVLTDLEGEGYTARPFIIPAAAVNAPHRRDRVFVVAHSNQQHGNDGRHGAGKIFRERSTQAVISGGKTDVADSNGERELQSEGVIGESWGWTGNGSEDVTNTSSAGLQEWRRSERTKSAAETGTRLEPQSKRCSSDVSDANSAGREEQHAAPFTYRQRLGAWGTPSGWEQWSTEPDVGRVANGIPNRVDRLKALGNAVVPQQIYPIFKAIMEIEAMNIR
ncbi:DNA (cytosine-5-)-methyltransferase [Paenibacillus sp. TAB 01]|uniref:DNA (cytosine-5-)-methyltransferase n=1 Tax=Paenibacillus sp. TAB 01 TaxID=3368988 RepID=UPI0037500BE7